MLTILLENDLSSYAWILVFGAIFAFFAGVGIGANDVANAFATSVGARALTLKQAVILAAIFEFCGAFFMGSHVTKTVRKGIADYKCFIETPGVLMDGMMCVVFAVGVWLWVATYFELPVSTTHSCVGGIIFMTLAATNDRDCVTWYEKSDDFPYMKGVSAIVLSWVISPVFSGVAACTLFLIVRTLVLRTSRPFLIACISYPFIIMSAVVLNVFYTIYKGGKGQGTDDLSLSEAMTLAWCIGIGVALASIYPIYLLRQKIQKDFDNGIVYGEKRPSAIDEEAGAAPKLAGTSVEMDDRKKEAVEGERAGSLLGGNPNAEKEAAGGVSVQAVDVEDGGKPQAERQRSQLLGVDHYGVDKYTFWERFYKLPEILESLNEEIHKVRDTLEDVDEIHDNAEKFDPRAESIYRFVQVFTAICSSFAHGANDVANAMGPFAAIYIIYSTDEVSKKAELGDNAFWILGIGGVGIVIGLAFYGYKIVCAIGVKLAKITPTRGSCIELGGAIVIITGSRLGIPLSTTHCQVGATVGVAMLEGVKTGVNGTVLCKTAAGWVATLLIVGAFTVTIFAQQVYAPSVYTQQ